jgi:hypothetical protein
LQKLNADRAIQAYFLSVAEAYGDQLRAGELRASLAEIDQKIAEAQTVTNKTLVGNSDAAIENRSVITGLVQNYQDYIQSLAAAGADQATLKAAIANSKQAFIDQATQLGFNQTEVMKYAASFDDMTVAINNVPRNITISVNPNPAIQALKEFEAQAARSGASAGAGFAAGMTAGLSKVARGIELQNQIAQMQATLASYISSGNISGARYMGQAIHEYSVRLRSGNYAEGGAIHGAGTATSDSIPIWASDGEFMMRTKAVAALGTPLLNYMNKYGRLPGFAMGGPIVSNAAATPMMGGVVELGPKSLGVMRSAIEREVAVYLDGRAIGRSVDEYNKTKQYQGVG